MKMNVRKLTSVTLLTAMVLGNLSSSAMMDTVYGSMMENTELEAAAGEIQDPEPEEAGNAGGMETDPESLTPEMPEESMDPEAEVSDADAADETVLEQQTVMEEEEPDRQAAPEEVQVSMHAAEYDPETGTRAGTPQNLEVALFNPTEEDAEFRLYFWDYKGEETSVWNIPEYMLTEPCMDMNFAVMSEDKYILTELTGSGGEVLTEAIRMHNEIRDDQIVGRYFSVELPAGYYMDSVFPVVSDTPESVVGSPVVFQGDEYAEFDRCLMNWLPLQDEAEELQDEAVQEETINAEETESGETEMTVVENDGISEDDSEAGTDTSAEADLTEKKDDSEADESKQVEETSEETIPDYLREKDFSSMRLLVMMKDDSKIREKDTVIGNYENIYLIQFETVKDCMAAYVYYSEYAQAVEPDTDMVIASEDAADGSDQETEYYDDNPVAALSSMEGAVFNSKAVIALLDTGAAASANVIDRVSLIDDVLEGHTHGNQMVKAITDQNPGAQILSIRVMGNDGRGTVSAIVAGMEYAMEHGASIINLSLSAKKNQLNAVLEEEIKKAVSMGILVVGAAGNNSADVMNYMPGCLTSPYIIGACNESGVRLATSNYGTTVDYNVVAGTTSEAAAKFSGLVSLAGIDNLKVNEGILYTINYVARPVQSENENEETEGSDGLKEPEGWEDLSEEELADIAGADADGPYPGKGSSVKETVKIWNRDTAYDFVSFNPYQDDENVTVECTSDISEEAVRNQEKIEAEYICSLKEDPEYKWNLFVTFVFTNDRILASAGSDMLDHLMPEMVCQDRNAGYGGIVPEYMGDTVEGRTFTVLKDTEDFDIHGLLIDYNPETFKINNTISDGGFDISVPGVYTVTFEMSYFLYPEYTWFVNNTVIVEEKEYLAPGIYLTSSESTLAFCNERFSHNCGYGDLVNVEAPEEHFRILCIDEKKDFEVEVSSSSETVTADICSLTDNGDGSKDLYIQIPEEITEAVILTMYRPGYDAAKFFTGGGWAGEEYDKDEAVVDQLTAEEMDIYEDIVLGKIEADDDEYMEIADTWTTVESTSISGTIFTGSGNTTNNSWSIGYAPACNYGIANVTAKKAEIEAWITEKGYTVDTSQISNFSVNCCSGHNYLGLWPNRTYYTTFHCQIDRMGNEYRLKIYCSLYLGSDQHGNYQSFYGSRTFSNITSGARLRVFKRFRDYGFMDWNERRYGTLRTTFTIYPAHAYNPATGIINTSVQPASTIVLLNDDGSTTYGESDILDPGFYYVVESRRIPGTVLNTDVYGPVAIYESDSGVINLQDRIDYTKYKNIASNKYIYNNPMFFNGKILTKTDEFGAAVADAIYKVEYSNASSAAAFQPVRTWYFKTDANGDLNYDYAHYVGDAFSYNGKTYQSDPIIDNSTHTLPMLPFGFIRITEVKPPSEIYDIDTNTYTLELAAQKDAGGEYTIRRLVIKGNIPNSIDKLRYWKLTVEKASQASDEVLDLNSYSLADATFGVFSDSACKKRVQLYSDDKLTVKVPDNTFKTDKFGKTPTYYLKAEPGASKTYYVKELTAPLGHQLAENPVAIDVKMPDDALQLKTASFTEGFSEPYDTMELDALVEKLSMHGHPVEGVVFKVCYYDDSSANAGQLVKTWYLVSDAEGKVFFDQNHVYTGDTAMGSDPFFTDPASGEVVMPVGGYVTLQEVKAPAEYVIDDTVRGFATKNQKMTVERLYNDLVPAKIRLKKYDKTGASPLAGVQFELAFVKAAQTDTSLAKEYVRLLKEGETTTLTTNENGEITFDNLDHGTYEITEVKTVPGQTLLKEKITVEIPITMTKEEAESYGNVDFSSAKEDLGYTNQRFFFDCLYEITNTPQFHIPQTGADGDWKLGQIGIVILMIMAGICYSNLEEKKRKLNIQKHS